MTDLRPGRFADRHPGKGPAPGDEAAGAEAGPAAGQAAGPAAEKAVGSWRSGFSDAAASAKAAHRAPGLSSLSARLESLGLADWHGKTVKRPDS